MPDHVFSANFGTSPSFVILWNYLNLDTHRCSPPRWHVKKDRHRATSRPQYYSHKLW